MSAFTIQLNAYGQQDYYLTGNPDISFFKKVYRRHTHYAKEIVNIQFGQGDIEFDHQFQAIILKKGELLSDLFLEIDLECKNTGTASYTVNHFLNSLIKDASIVIGDNTIEKYISQWKQIKYELTTKNNNNYYKSSEVGGGNPTNFNFINSTNRTEYTTDDIFSGNSPLVVGGGGGDKSDSTFANNVIIKKKMIYNFDFWFTRNIGQALPVICLNNHDILLKFNTESKEELIGDSTNIDFDTFKMNNITLRGEYVHLYGDEKRRFTQSSHEYLIEQLQYKENIHTFENVNTANTLHTTKFNLNSFKHPIKYIAWVVQNKGTLENNKGRGPCYFTSMTTNSYYETDGNVGNVDLKFNGITRTLNLPMIYYTRLYPKKLFNRVPSLDRIGIYSFSLKPLEHQPSGTCNFSKINMKTLEITFGNNNSELIKNKPMFIFAVNYNVFRINNGISGLLFM